MAEQQEFSWEVEQFRLTLFRFPGTSMDVQSLWQEIGDIALEDVKQKPALGVTSLEGSGKLGRYILATDNQRLDFIAHKLQLEPDLPVIGKLEEALPEFVNQAERLIGKVSGILRVAVSFSLLSRTSDKIQSYSLLSHLLPSVDIDIEDSSDFLYQINRPRTSNVVEGLSINRLSKWGAVKISFPQFVPGLLAISNASPMLEAIKLDLDINSALERVDEIPTEKLHELMIELIGLAVEISQKGDIK